VAEGLRLAGKVALVTGASRGIGEAISRRFAREGAAVALAARDEAACRSIAQEIEADGGRALALETDVTDAGHIARTVAAVVSKWGRIDVLVNNAGLGGPTPLTDPDDTRWDAILATNLTAVFRMTRAALPHLSDGARIINLSSVVGRFGVAGLGAYSATKHGVIGLTHHTGCGMADSGPGWEVLRRTLTGYARHPNIGGLVVIGLGCEINAMRSLVDEMELPAWLPMSAAATRTGSTISNATTRPT